MVFDIAREHLEEMGLEDRIYTFGISSATVRLAASAMGCEPAQIAKTLPLMVEDGSVFIVTAGDAKVDNRKCKEQFRAKTKMFSPDEMTDLAGRSIGGVCPFGVKEGVRVYPDEPLECLDTVYPVCESVSSAVRLPIPKLERASGYLEWIDVCKV